MAAVVGLDIPAPRKIVIPSSPCVSCGALAEIRNRGGVDCHLRALYDRPDSAKLRTHREPSFRTGNVHQGTTADSRRLRDAVSQH